MNTEQELLKPCPFCGAKPILANDYDGDRYYWHPGIDDPCPAASIQIDPNDPEVIAAWNRRSSDEQAEVVGPAAWALEGKLRDGGTDLRLPFLTKQEDADRYQARNPDEVLVPLYRAPAVAAGGVTGALEALQALVLLLDLFEASERTHKDAFFILAQQPTTWERARAAVRSLAVGDEGIREGAK